MAVGDKSDYSDKQIRQAHHIRDHYISDGYPRVEAEKIAWSTVNKQDGGGIKKRLKSKGSLINFKKEIRMAIKFKNILGLDIEATDGTLGSVKDVYFDDQTWQIRYFVIDTSKWLLGKKVLISPDAISAKFTGNSEHLPVNLTKKQIEDSPSLAEEEPVSRQFELSLHTFYGWTPYWGLTGPIASSYPDAYFQQNISSYSMAHADWGNIEKSRQENFDGHLRSLHEVTGYKIATNDGEEFGEVSDAIIAGKDLLIIDLILDSNRWLPGGKKFICSPMFVKDIDMGKGLLHLAQTKESLLNGPDFDFNSYGAAYRRALVDHYCDKGLLNSPQSSPEKTSNNEARL